MRTCSIRVLFFIALLLPGLTGLQAKVFPLASGTVDLQEVTSTTEVYYRSMRFNRVSSQWNFDLVLRNTAVAPLAGPVVVLVESYQNTSGPIAPDGRDEQGKAWFEVTQLMPPSGLNTGQESAARTLSLGLSTGVPQVSMRVFASAPVGGPALAFSRSLNEFGQPLPGVQVAEYGPAGQGTNLTDGRFGVATLGQGAGMNRFMFSAEGYLPVWRQQLLVPGSVIEISSPRLLKQGTNAVVIGASGGLLSSSAGNVRITIPAGAVTGTARLTLGSQQALAAPLPPGWSPLQFFWLELAGEPTAPLSAQFDLWRTIRVGETAALVRWDAVAGSWVVSSLLSGLGVANVAVTLPSSGAWAVVAPDAGIAPAAAGQPLPSRVLNLPDYSQWEIGTSVTPSTSSPSRVPELVTATATLVISNKAGAISSGTALRARVTESYRMRNGTMRFTPVYETWLTGYRRGTNAAVLEASFPLRPLLLYSGEELLLALVNVEILPPTSFAGGVLTGSGGSASNGIVRVTAGQGILERPQAVQITPMTVTNFQALSSPGMFITNAFQLAIGELGGGAQLALQISNLPPSSLFVLARVLAESGVYGLEPVGRYGTDAQGNLQSTEPAAEPKLSGLAGSGQFILAQVSSTQALVRGVARNSESNAVQGILVRLGPWVTSSGPDGSYELLAPAGTATVTFQDVSAGNTATVQVEIPGNQQVVSVPDQATQAVRPRVVAVTPASGSTNVSVVAAISVSFSKPLNPGTLIPGAVQLTGPDAKVVPISFSLNVAGDQVSVFPIEPLTIQTGYTLSLSPTITDLGGLTLEGVSQFSFTTGGQNFVRDLGAQLVLYEPTNGVMRIVGTVGFAQPGQPVVLVNETSGRTATVLANVDGSFSGSLAANTDDQLGVAVQNSNGTRDVIRPDRLLYADGSVGLFSKGGTLTTGTENGPMEIVIDPGTLTGPARFNIEAVPSAQVMSAVSNTVPESGQIVGVFRATMTGGEMTYQAHLRFPVDEAKLGLAPGDSPSNHVFALCELINVDGTNVYRVADNASWEDGHVVTKSPPFEGLMLIPGISSIFALTMIQVTPGQEMKLVGYVVAAQASVAANTLNSEITEGLLTNSAALKRVPGAIVQAHPGGIGLGGRPGLRTGAFVARSNSRGAYALLVPFNPLELDAISVTATSHRLPNYSGFRVISRQTFEFTARANIIIPLPDSPSGVIDFMPPMVSAQPPTTILPVGTNVVVPFLLRDDQSQPYLHSFVFEPDGSMQFEPLGPLPATSVAVPEVGAGNPLGTVSTLTPVTLRVGRAGMARFRLIARDQSGNETESVVAFRFGTGPSEPPGPIQPSSSNDYVGPVVVATVPASGGMLMPGDPIELKFSEALKLSSTNGVSINGNALVQAEISVNQRSLRIYPAQLQMGSNYTITVNSEVRDLSGNSLDQDPSTQSLESFLFRFQTPAVGIQTPEGVISPGGSVVFGNHSYTLDRSSSSSGYLRIHRLDGEFPLVNSVFLPAFPRSMALIPSYSFKRRPEAQVETKPLLVIVGGLAGQLNSWMRIYDISRPESTGIWGSFSSPTPVNTNAWVAGTVLSADPLSIPTLVKFSAPRLAVQMTTAEGGFINMINLQALIMGANLAAADWSASPDRTRLQPGTDLNRDGDYVDEGEQLPFPQYSGLFGLESMMGPPPGRDITDFDLANGGRDLVALFPRTASAAERFQVFSLDGFFVGDGSDALGGLEFPTNSVSFPTNRAFRVALDADFPVPDTNGMRYLPVALVSGGDLLRVIDLSVPQTPVLLSQFRLGTNTGTIFSIQRTGADEYTVGTAGGVWTLRRSTLFTQGRNSMQQIVPIPFEGRALGASGLFYVASSGNKLRIAALPPRLSIIRAPEFAVTNMAAVISQGPAQIRAFLEKSAEPNLLLPVVQRSMGTNWPQGLRPPNPLAHHYVIVQAPGIVGPSIRVALESVDAQGKLLSPRGTNWPPIVLSSQTGDMGFTGQHPAVESLVALRLASNPTNEFYNYFITDPFVVVREPLTRSNQLDLPLIEGRRAVWSGHMLRVSLESTGNPPAALAPYLSKVNLAREFQTGLSKTYSCIPGDLTPNPNPSMRVSPTVAGVNLQSGAFRTSASDIYVQGRNLPLTFTRNYDSRGQYSGVLGNGWDFNWNTRIVEIPQELPVSLPWMYFGEPSLDSAVRSKDVLLMDGNGAALLFKELQPGDAGGYTNDPAIATFGWENAIETYYSSPVGEFAVLYRFKDGGWVTVAQNGIRTYFRSDGKLDRIIGTAEASQLTCTYRDDGKLDQVAGDRDIVLRFGYFQRPGSLDLRQYDRIAEFPYQLGLLARVQVRSPEGVISELVLRYDNQANLAGAKRDEDLETVYGYSTNSPAQLTSIGRGDGARFPSQRIVYTDGLVSKVLQDGKEIAFSGAVGTAAERYATPSAGLQVKQGDSPGASYTVDNRGRPLSFANMTNTADDAGLFKRVANAETKTDLIYDKENEVYRFRGNLLGTQQANRPSYDTSFVYDGSAWNRLVSRTTAEGVTTTNVFTTVNGIVTQMDEITGPIIKRTYLNNYGQVLKEELRSGDYQLIRNVLYSATTHLPKGEQLGSSPAADFTQGVLGGFDRFGSGDLSYTNAYNSDRQLTGLVPQSGKTPGVELVYSNNLVVLDRLFAGTNEMVNRYEYDPSERTRVVKVITRETGLPESVTEYRYDDQARMTNFVQNGEVTRLVYDQAQVTEKHSPGFDRVVNYSGALPTNVVEQGVSALLAYDEQQRLQSLTQQGATYLFSYNLGDQLAGKVISNAVDGVLLDESYTYDSAGRVERIESEASTRRFEYFPDGKTRRFWVDDLLVQEFERDDSGRVTKASVPGVMERIHSNPDPVTALFRREELRLFYSEGAGYRPFVIDRTFDAVGRELTEVRPCGVWSTEYDVFGRLARRTDPDNVIYEQQFSPGGLPLVTRFTDGTTVSYSYDANHRPLTVGSLSNSYSSDKKLLETKKWPDGSITTLRNYNQFVQPETVTHGSLQQFHTWEDGRLTKLVSGSDVQEYSYDAIGRPKQIRLNDSAVDFTYNAAGQLDSETYTPPAGEFDPLQWTATFTNRNRLISETYPSGLELDWVPNDYGLPVESEAAGISKIEWLGAEMLQAIEFAGGLRIVRDYDDSQRFFAVRYLTGPAEAPTTNAALLYQLSPGGRILSETREHEERSDIYGRNSNLEGMRVVNFSFSTISPTNSGGAEALVHGLSFDGNGELLAPTNAAGADARGIFPSFTLNDGRVTTLAGLPVAYNDRGSVTQVPVWVRLPGDTNLSVELATLTYDGLDMLKQVERGAGTQKVTVTYDRDGLGRIVQRTVSGPPARCHPGTRIYSWKGKQLIEEYELEGAELALSRRYVYLGADLVLVQAAAVPGEELTDYVPIVSLNGSIGGYLNLDGSLEELIVYGAYGTPVIRAGGPGSWTELPSSKVGSTLLFQGGWFDEETGLYQLGQRNLHPVWGRFLQRETKMYAVSRAVYAAFNGDPAGVIDPSGALPEVLQKGMDVTKGMTQLVEKGGKFREALSKAHETDPRKETDIAKKGLDLTKSLFTFAETLNDEEFKQFSTAVTGTFDHMQTGLDVVQEVLDWRKDRLILTAIRANTAPFGNARFETRWIAAGGSMADLESLELNFFQEEEILNSRGVRRQGGLAPYNHYLKAKDDYIGKREAHLIKLANVGANLAGAYLEYAFKGDSGREVQVAKQVLEGSKLLLKGAEVIRDVARDEKLAKMSFKLGEVASIEGAEKLFGVAGNVKAAFDVGFEAGQYGIMMLSDPWTAKAYKEATEEFTANGGFLSVFGGLLSTVGLDSTAYQVQKLAESGWKGFIGDKGRAYLERITQPDPRWECYQRDLDAP